jgi:hypothetical protein
MLKFINTNKKDFPTIIAVEVWKRRLVDVGISCLMSG